MRTSAGGSGATLDVPGARRHRSAVRCHIAPRPGGLPDDLGDPRLPGSKSHTQRALLAAAFTTGEWRLHGALRSDDTEVLLAAVARCGARATWVGDTLVLCGNGAVAGLDVELDVGENGTAARTLLVLVPLLGGCVRVDGAPGLRRRPMAAAAAVLRHCGIAVDRDQLPIRADGRAIRLPATIAVDASVTTQVATGVLLAQALRGRGSMVVHGVRAPAYVQLTAWVLRQMGAPVEGAATVPGHGVPWQLCVRGPIQPSGSLAIPVDPSARAFPLALAALHGRDGTSRLPALPGDPHPDWAIDGDLRALLQAGDQDLVLDGLGARPDCVPAVAAVAANRRGRTRLGGLPALRVKESDRLQALVDLVRSAGARGAVHGDDLLLEGPLGPVMPRAGTTPELAVVPDHRIVMAAALLGTALPAGAMVAHHAAVAKSWPGFFDWLGRCALVQPA